MKILIIRTFPNVLNVNSYNAQELGLAKAFAAKGHDCDVVYYCGKEADHIQDVPGEGPGKVRILWLHGSDFLNNGIFPSLEKLLPQYDVIQTNGYDQYVSWKLYTGGRKNVFVYHGSYDCAFNKRYNLRARLFDALLLTGRRGRFVSVPCFTKSVPAAEFLRSKGFRDVTPVGVGLDTTRIEAAQPDPWVSDLVKNKGDQKYLLYIGDLSDRRNVCFTIRTAARVMEQRPRTRLILVGKSVPPEYSREMEAAIRETGIKDRVCFRESLPQQALKPLYRASDVFLLPSRYEIFGMVLLEAMYLSVPTITTHNGGSSMLIEDGVNGFARDAEESAWAGLIEDIVAGKYPQMGERAAGTVRERFLWPPIAETMLAKYSAVLGEKKG